MDDVTIDEAVTEAIGECAGYVSLCWNPRPSGVFDSTSASGAVEKAVARVLSAMREERAAGFAEAIDKASAVAWALEDQTCGCMGGYTIDVVAGEAIEALRGKS